MIECTQPRMFFWYRAIRGLSANQD